MKLWHETAFFDARAILKKQFLVWTGDQVILYCQPSCGLIEPAREFRGNQYMKSLIRYRDLVLPISMIGCLVVILVPLPTAVLDLLIAGNITIAVVMFLTTMYVAKPLDFSVFPTLLLATTLARLVLNVATTRLILTGAERNGSGAAGQMIESFGTFVAGDQVEVGLVIFVILVVIQFVVITKGATRISEVAARFALDGMPGRQMAVDSDFNAGVINEETARRRREEISEQADFYGTMDGASKFVRGDAIAAVIITVVNIIGGLYVGMVHLGMSLTSAASMFTKLTIGDGLVSQIPALLISLSAGFLVTRSSKPTNLPDQLLQQLLGNSRALFIAGGFLLILVITNLPAVPVASLGIGCVGIALVIGRHQKTLSEEENARILAIEAEKNAVTKSRVEDFLTVDPMEIAIGTGLLDLADPNRGGDLMERITKLRNIIASDLGIILPKVRVRDDRNLIESEYVIRVHGNVVSRKSLRTDSLLASETGDVTGHIEGGLDTELVQGVRSFWIDASQAEQAAIFGYTVQHSVEVLIGDLRKVVTRHADELLSRDATKHLLDELRTLSPMVVDELVPNVMKISEVQHVLQLLLQEDVPIRQMGLILETLGDVAAYSKEPEKLVELVRSRLARTISSRYRDENGVLHVLTLDPVIEARLCDGLEQTDYGTVVQWSPLKVESLCTAIGQTLENAGKVEEQPLLLVSPKIRSGLRRLIAPLLPELRVLSFGEISSQTKVESHGLVSEQGLQAAA